VEQNGCLLSEYPPGTEPYAGHFPVRNRIISALSLGVLVVEAPEKSGALITADRALEQGRDVFVLPANVDAESCSGNLKLLRDGAIPVRDAWDILQEYEAQYPQTLSRQPVGNEEPGDYVPQPEPEKPPEKPKETKKVIDKPKNKAYIDLKDRMDTLSRDEQLLAQLLQDGPMHVDVIVDRTQMGTGRALASLTLLEVKGIVQRPSARMYELAEV
jgi:DNA processing protein